MKWIPCLIVLVVLGGCAVPALDTTNPAVDPLAHLQTCGGTFPDGQPVHCEQRATLATVESAVPGGWIESPSSRPVDIGPDSLRFYRESALPGAAWGVHFDLAPRTEGDYESPEPTIYGGVFRFQDGPLFSWESNEPSGFVRAPQPVPGNALDPARGAFIVYVPIQNGNVSAFESATVERLWNVTAGSPDDFRVVHAVTSPAGTYYLREGLGLGQLGHSFAVGSGSQVSVFHVYLLLDTSDFPLG